MVKHNIRHYRKER